MNSQPLYGGHSELTTFLLRTVFADPDFPSLPSIATATMSCGSEPTVARERQGMLNDTGAYAPSFLICSAR